MSIANELEQHMLDLINAERAANGVAALKLEQHLNDSSEDHSTWVLNTDTFSHTGAGGSSAYQRMVAAGFDFSGDWRSGENIGLQSIRGEAGYFDDVEDIHGRLMDSTGHRWNILNAEYEYVGIGIEIGEYNGFNVVMITQNFAETDGSVLVDPYGDGSGSGSGGSGGSGGTGGTTDLIGNSGDNTLTGGSEDNLIKGLSGRDVLSGNLGQDTIMGGSGSDSINGGGDHDVLKGGNGHDTIVGAGGNDLIEGGKGKDNLSGGSGNDTLDGGMHKDVLTGGTGADVFVFTDAAHSTTRSDRDKITDFSTTDDLIDLSGVDAVAGVSGNQAFTFIGEAKFSGVAGELRYREVSNGANREIQGDTDGDGNPDFLILVTGSLTLAADDFVL